MNTDFIIFFFVTDRFHFEMCVSMMRAMYILYYTILFILYYNYHFVDSFLFNFIFLTHLQHQKLLTFTFKRQMINECCSLSEIRRSPYESVFFTIFKPKMVSHLEAVCGDFFSFFLYLFLRICACSTSLSFAAVCRTLIIINCVFKTALYLAIQLVVLRWNGYSENHYKVHRADSECLN